MAQRTPQKPARAASGHGPGLGDLGVLTFGLALVVAGANNTAVNLAAQKIGLPAPGVLWVRAIFVVVGLVVLGSDLIHLLGLTPARISAAGQALREWRRRRRQRALRDAGQPPQPTADLVRRQEELDWLHDRLLGSRRRLFLSGMPGVGKTQLAATYVAERGPEYGDGVYWLSGERQATLASDLWSLAWPLGLAQPGRSDEELVASWLRQHSGWLIVVDNLEEGGEDGLEQLLPQHLQGSILVTCRHSPRSDRELTPLPLELATLFLLQRTGQSDEAAARLVADELGGLPLALQQAVAYLKDPGEKLATYAELLQKRTREILDSGPPEDYPATVAAALSLSVHRLARQEPAAADLLRLCAFLAPEQIPLSLLEHDRGILPKRLRSAARDRLRLNQLVKVLRQYALAVRQPEADLLSVHRLVQTVVRSSLATAQRQEWAISALRLTAGAFPANGEDVASWPECRLLLPHALTSAERAESEGCEVDQYDVDLLARLSTEAGCYLLATGVLQGARAQFERALAIQEVLSPDHPDAATAHENLSSVLKQLGDLKGARAQIERALAIDEAAYGPDHPDVATDRNRLGLVLQHLGDAEGARAQIECALAIRERALGADHPYVAADRQSLGQVLEQLGDLKGARAQIERALAIDEAAYGPDDIAVAKDRYILGPVLAQLGDPEGARTQIERALAIFEAAYGPEHPDVGMAHNGLGLVLEQLGDLEGARAQIERALAIDEAAYGPDHIAVATDRNALGVVLQQLGDLEGARAQIERALAIDEAAYGPDHIAVASDRNNLGEVLRQLGDLRGARAQFERALAINEAAYGPDHPEAANDCDSLGTVLLQLGDLEGARAQLERALAIHEAVYGPDHPAIAKDRDQLARLAGDGQGRETTDSSAVD